MQRMQVDRRKVRLRQRCIALVLQDFRCVRVRVPHRMGASVRSLAQLSRFLLVATKKCASGQLEKAVAFPRALRRL